MSNATPPIGYEVKFQRVGVGGGADLQIRSLLDKQQFYDPLGLALAAGISSATWPLFGLVWPSAQSNAFHKDMANMGFGVTEIIINEPLQDLSAYRGRLLHYKRG
jgi:hypothetical protein